jgi:hypothetical protein
VIGRKAVRPIWWAAVATAYFAPGDTNPSTGPSRARVRCADVTQRTSSRWVRSSERDRLEQSDHGGGHAERSRGRGELVAREGQEPEAEGKHDCGVDGVLLSGVGR